MTTFRHRVAFRLRPVFSPAIIAAIVLMVGCVPTHRSAATDVDPRAWRDPAVVTISNTDTTTLRDMALFLRCNDRFSGDTLTVNIVVHTPDSLRYEEPFLLTVPPAHTVAAVTREVAVPYRHRVLLGRAGNYRITITPARTVKGIEAVGINID